MEILRTDPQTLQRARGIDMEQYTYIEQKKAHLVLCVFDRKGDYPGEKMCAGPLCMGWVRF